jgi:hypothetical protein
MGLWLFGVGRVYAGVGRWGVGMCIGEGDPDFDSLEFYMRLNTLVWFTA